MLSNPKNILRRIILPTILLVGSMASIATLLIFSPFHDLWKTKTSEAAGEINVYYSVGQNTSDHKTGTPTISITGNTATFSVPQTATNMGVGDQISYGNPLATTTAYISGKTSSTTWSVITRLGGQPTATTTATVLKISHAFSSLNAAVGGATPGAANASHLATSNLTSGSGYIMNIPCYYDSGPDTTAVAIGGWTTATSTYIKIYTPYNISTEVNQSQRHDGKWNTEKYRMENTSSETTIQTSVLNFKIEGLQIKHSRTSGYPNTIYLNKNDASSDYYISNNILKGNFSGTTNNLAAIGTPYGSAINAKVWNNIFYGYLAVAGTGRVIYATNGGNWRFYNNTVYNSTGGFYRAGGTFVAKNNLFVSVNAPTGGIFATGTDYNATDNASMGYTVSGNIHDKTSISTTNLFTNLTPDSEDFHLTLNSTLDVKGLGYNATNDSYLPFSVDIDGELRPSFEDVWCKGADEYATLSEAPQISNIATSSISSTTATITWTTSAEATSTIYYATDTYYNDNSQTYNQSSSSEESTTTHTINLSGLTEYTSYHFYIEATNATGTATSSDLTFTTSDVTAPIITPDSFSIPATSSSLTITFSEFTATDTDGSGVAGYLVTQTSATPSSTNPSWETEATTTYTFSTDGTKTLYAWAKDNAGNISTSVSDTTTIALTTSSTSYHWVSPTGTASWANCFSTSPLSGTAACSLTTANSSLVAGDTVMLRGGNYSVSVPQLYGAIRPVKSGVSASAKITYQAYSPGDWEEREIPILTNANFFGDIFGISIYNNKDYIVVKGLTFVNFDRWGQIAELSDYNEISYCEFYNTEDYYNAGGSSWGLFIFGSYTEYKGSTHNWIHHNILHDLSSPPPSEAGDIIKIGAYDPQNSDSNYNTIEDNILYHAGHTLTDNFCHYNVWKNNIGYNDGFKDDLPHITGNATGGSTTSLIDTTKNFSELGVMTGIFLYLWDLDTPTEYGYKYAFITSISTTTNPGDTLNYTSNGYSTPNFSSGSHSYDISTKYQVYITPPSNGKFGHRNFQLDSVARDGFDYNLFEGNRGGHSAPNPGTDGDEGISLSSGSNILRFNSFFGNSSSGFYFKNGAHLVIK